MRIACLQFSPQVGDIDNNLNRADAVLNKAKPEELEALDLLVLPEMAFSGYNFKSLHQIHPFLEPSGSGVSSLWARTTALKFNTNVIVGYPEKVDIREKWPASPEYYDSAIMVNGDGETVLNYRKRFLYKTDETWALEGDGGFHSGDIPGLGKTVVGICMDLNPYRFESPWNAFEFGFHALEVEPSLIVVSMSWVTRRGNREFSRMLADPDMETLTYWVQRLEPLIKAELDREVIVVFCNRCGQEQEALYAGTSAIIGIKGGEVNVYALAGRGTKEFLMADTSNPPFAKLVQSGDEAEKTSPGLMTWPAMPPLPPPARSSTANAFSTNSIAPPRGEGIPSSHITISSQRGRDRPSPRIQIPNFGSSAFCGDSSSRVGTVDESPITIPTPEAPSPTPLSLRPKLIITDAASVFGDFWKSAQYPHDEFLAQQFRFFGNQHQPSPAVPPEQDPALSRYYWKPSDTLLNAPFDFNWASSPESDNGPKISAVGPLTPYPGSDIPTLWKTAKHNTRAKGGAEVQPGISERTQTSADVIRSNSVSSSTGTLTIAGPCEKGEMTDSLEISRKMALPPQRASSPKQRSGTTSRNGSRGNPTAPKHSSSSPRRERDAFTIDPPASAASDARPSWLDNAKSLEHTQGSRPESPKCQHSSRNRSRTGTASQERGAYSRGRSDTPVNRIWSAKDRARGGLSPPPSRRGQTSEDRAETTMPGSRTTSHHVANGDSERVRTPGVLKHVTEKSSPEMAGVTLPKLHMRAQSPGGRFDETRPISRGRQRWISREPPPQYSETPPPSQPLVQVQGKQPQAQAQTTNMPPVPRQVSITRMQSASGLVGIRFATPEDEIIAIEEYIDPICNMHSRRAASASAISHKIPSIADGRAIVGLRANLPPPPPVSVLDVEDEPEDGRAAVLRTPSVLGGSVKATVLDMSPSPTESSVSVLSPRLGAKSAMISPTFPSRDSPSDLASVQKFDKKVDQMSDPTSRAMAVVQFATMVTQIDMSIPLLACIQCDHSNSVDESLKTGPLDPVKNAGGGLPQALFSDLLVPAPLLKRRSW